MGIRVSNLKWTYDIDLGLWGVLKEVTYFREGADFLDYCLFRLSIV